MRARWGCSDDSFPKCDKIESRKVNFLRITTTANQQTKTIKEDEPIITAMRRRT